MYYFLSTALPFTKPDFYVWAACIGFNLTLLFVYFLKSVESAFISKLLELGTTSKDSAVTINDISLRGKILLKFLLRDNATLRDVIFMVGVDDVKGESQTDVADEGEVNGDAGVDNDEGSGVVKACEGEGKEAIESRDDGVVKAREGEGKDAIESRDDGVVEACEGEGKSNCEGENIVESVAVAEKESGSVVNKVGKKKEARVKIDFDSARFYINEKKADKLDALKKGAIKWFMLPIYCAVSIGLAIGISYLIPIFQNW